MSLFIAMLLAAGSMVAQGSQNGVSENGRKGLDFTMSAGYDINTKGGGGSILTELELGKRFTKNFYWGFGAGAAFATTSGGAVAVPVTTNIKAFFPSGSSPVEPFAMLKVGYSINTDDLDYSGIMLSIMPGIQFPLSKTIDMNLAAGYSHYIYDDFNAGAIVIRMGFDIHNAPNHLRKSKQPKPLLPSKEHGFQLTIEGGIKKTENNEFGQVALVGSYKLSQLLSAGVGFEYSGLNSTVNHTHVEGSQYRLFGRGQYRFSDRRIAPFVALDGGYKFHEFSYDPAKANAFGHDYEKPTAGGFFVTPAVGLSLRTSRNSYLDLRAGYQIESGIDERKQDGDRYERVYDAIPMSGILVKLGFTHTF